MEATSVLERFRLYFQGEYWLLGIAYLVMLIASVSLIPWVVSYLVKPKKDRLTPGHGKTMIILGSGGHTKEILSLSKHLSSSFNPRVYVYTESDQLSLEKAREAERERTRKRGQKAKFFSVVRIRDVGQSFSRAFFFRAPAASYQSAKLIIQEKPDVLLCNGPGVCVPICFVAFVLNILRVTNTRIIFIESICRVKTLSLSGRLMIRLAHRFIVQWEDLQKVCQAKYPNSKVIYLGRLC